MQACRGPGRTGCVAGMTGTLLLAPMQWRLQIWIRRPEGAGQAQLPNFGTCASLFALQCVCAGGKSFDRAWRYCAIAVDLSHIPVWVHAVYLFYLFSCGGVLIVVSACVDAVTMHVSWG